VSSGRWLLVALGALAVGAVAWVAASAASVSDELARERDLHEVEHVTSGECARCHPAQHESWARTFHRTMTQEATERAVLGDFDGAALEYGGVTAHFERGDDGAFRMRFVGPDGRTWSEATVVRTVGSRRYQQYLAAEGDVLFRLPVAWHVGEQRWFHMNGAFLTPDPPRDGDSVAPEDYYRHVTRWNDNCVFCHNVGANPGQRDDGFDTEVAELGIACEACHGPAEAHARLNADPVRRYALHLGDRPDPSIVNPARLSPERSAEVCGRCHGQRIASDVGPFLRDGDPFVPGDRLADYTRPLTRETSLGGDPTAFADRFWPDGTARLTAYEYQGLLQSRCDELTCVTCHGMHEGDPRGQLRDEARGDGACTGCHGDLDGPAHSGHPARSAVACVDCHMPRIVYGVVEVHRSHRIERPVPRADRPGACASCHADRTDRWLREGYSRLYERALPPGDGGWPRAHRDVLAGDPIERAVAAHALGDGRALLREPRRLALLLDVIESDPYPAVRHIAHRSLRRLRPELPDGFVPEADVAARAAWARAARDVLGPLDAPDPATVARLRARAAQAAIFIGE